MTGFAPARYVDGAPMLLAGLRRQHRFSEMGQGIAQQWLDFRALGTLPAQVGTRRYGVICGVSAQTLEYMCAAEVADLAAVPIDLGKMRIRAEHYAVFEHRGPIEAISTTWARIWKEWLPASGHQSAQRPDFELYDARFDPLSGSGLVEIWIALAPGA